MKLRFFAAAALAAALFSCKNDATTDSKKPATEGTGVQGEMGEGAAEDIAPKEGEVLLRLNYPKGFKQQLNYIFESSGDAMNGAVAMVINYTVSDVSTGRTPVFDFTGEITGMKAKYDVQGTKMDYDSALKLPAKASESEREMDKKFRGIEGKPLSFALDKKGKVVKDMQFTAAAAPEDLPFDIKSYQIEFPSKPVAVGSTWTNKSIDKQQNGIKTNTYTLTKITDATVVIDVKSVWPAPAMRGAKPTVFTGSYTVDRKTGMLLNASMSGGVETVGGTITMTFISKEIK